MELHLTELLDAVEKADAVALQAYVDLEAAIAANQAAQNGRAVAHGTFGHALTVTGPRAKVLDAQVIVYSAVSGGTDFHAEPFLRIEQPADDPAVEASPS